jgi:hypothetical protein
MRKRWTAVFAIALLVHPALAQEVPSPSERFYQERFCAGMAIEVRLGQVQQRADCLSQTHAIEVEWHDRWKDAIGQALANSAASGRQPGIVLVCRSDQALCLAASLGVRQTLGHHHVGATLWDCLPIHRTLADCRRWEI